jgi:hypothetical protein
MKLRSLSRVGLAVTTSVLTFAACSDDPTPTNGGAGSANGGSSTAGTPATSGSSSGGSGTAGTATAGSAGSATAGHAGVAGSGGGTAGSAGTAGSGGSAGTAGSGGSGGSNNVGGEAGGGGEGGAGDEAKLLFDFETDVQGWQGSAADVMLASDPAQFVTGAKSLKVTIPALTAATSRTVAVEKVDLWPGATVVMHVWTPAPAGGGFYVQAYTQSNNWQKWDTAGNAPVTVVSGGWTTITYTVPQTFPGGLQLLGVQIGTGDGQTFAGGDFYVDSVTVTGGVVECAGTGTGTYGFETAAVEPWAIDGNPATPDTALAQGTEQFKTGTGALKVSFTALPAGTPDAHVPRRVFVDKPTAYCGDEVTLNVWAPLGNETMLFQAFSQSDNYADWHSDQPPAVITRGGWTQIKYTIPASIDSGGLQRVGIQFLNTGAAFTGDFFIDDVSW